jgi:hypothetical protein
MCFVSYVPLQDGYLLGSNRDERINRPAALAPLQIETEKGTVLMPRDGKAGGTWIAAREDGWSVVLLNGAFDLHVAQPPYRHSRGVIIPAMMKDSQPEAVFNRLDLQNIEPFTLIVAGPGQLFECRWNGMHKFQKPLDPVSAFCWSSATLYNQEQQKQRENWFLEAVEDGRLVNIAGLMHFHGTPGKSDPQVDIMLTRPNGMETVSTTIIRKDRHTMQMDYCDYLSGLRSSLHTVMVEAVPQL